MILPNDIHPNRSLYFIGADIIKILKTEPANLVDVYILYDKYIHEGRDKASLSYFLYALDWLYLIGVIDFEDQQNKLIKCF